MNGKLGYLMRRLAIVLSFFGHGLIRLPKLIGFSNWMMGQFSKSFLPDILVLPFSYVLPFAALFAGFLILIGLFTKQGLLLGGLITLALIFGSTMIESWEAIPSQLIHIAFISVLLAYLPENSFAVDKLLKRS